MSTQVLSILILSGFLTSILSAVTGMAGGVTLLAIMLLFLPPELAIPLHAVIQLLSNSSRVVVFLPHVRWKLWFMYAIPSIFGILMGAYFFQWIPKEHLRLILGLFILIAVHLPRGKDRRPWPNWSFAIAGVLSGMAGMIVGTVGPIIAPFFLHARVLKEKLIATKALCQTSTHIFKVIGFGALGFVYTGHTFFMILMGVSVVLGTYVGKRILKHVSEKVFVLVFKILLTGISIKLILEALL